jgi:ElaB/YqjD/DUF883 family membrane-anchored ribosome-binding protein
MDAENLKSDPGHVAAGPGSTKPRDLVNRGAEAYEQARQGVAQAYDKTAQAVTETYDQAMVYGREHPGTLTLIAFGAGFGLGLLLAGSRRSRSHRYAEPVVNALSDIALEYFRHR